MPTALVHVRFRRNLHGINYLVRAGWTILSSGESADTLEKSGIHHRKIEVLTGIPEILDERTKTLHPHILTGIFARRDDLAQMKLLENLGIPTIDLVIVTLRDFGKKPGVENIDLEGHLLTRAAASNYQNVVVVVDPNDNSRVIKAFTKEGGLSEAERVELALKAFEVTSEYDATISHWLGSECSLTDVEQ